MKKERLFYLDVVRTIAVICVCVCHYTRELEFGGVGYVGKILPDFLFNVYLGSFGVSLFFIISGVIISRQKLRSGTRFRSTDFS